MKGSINTLHHKLPCLEKDMDNFVRSQIRITPAPRRRHSGYVVRSKYPWPPKSPSTDSTTSLAQLHEKLTDLPPLIYNKVPQKISATPELPTVREVSENDDLGNTFNRTHLGVARHFKSIAKANVALSKKISPCLKTSDDKISLGKQFLQGYKSENEGKIPLVEKPLRAYQSDTETKTVVKKSRCISPVTKENSPSLMLVATLGTSDESIINDTYDKLRRNNPEYDLLELLVEEALHNDQEKDSGVDSKRTEDSGIVENTPIAKNVHGKKSNINITKQQTVVNNSTTTDESTTDVIDDTPCYVFDRKKRVQTNTKKDPSVIAEVVNTFDATAVDTFFSQHMTENNGSVYISPTLAKKINETSSEASDDQLADITILHEEYFNVIPILEDVADKDIVDCLNNMLDKVCSDLDKCIDLMNENHQHVEVLTNVQYFNETSSISSDVSKIKNTTSYVDDLNKPSDGNKKVTLKFNLSKKRAPKKKSQKSKDNKKSAKMDRVISENIKIESPKRATKPVVTRKKRKLYSPKDDDNNMVEKTRTIQKDESKQSNIYNTPIATCYKELEKARRSRIRLPRKSRASTEPLNSPKTKKLNDLFDKIKENVENTENVMFADRPRSKNYKDLTQYNLSSESEDQNFQERKIKVQKRVSSSSLETSAKKRSKVSRRQQFTNYCDFTSEDECKPIKTRKITKQPRPRSRKSKIEHNVSLIDERMRQAPPEVLETSFAIENVVEREAHAMEPAIQEPLVSEIMPDDEITDNTVLQNKTLTPKNTEISKENVDNIINKKHERDQNEAYLPNTSDIVKIKKEKAISLRQLKAQTPDTSEIVKIKKEKAVNRKNEKADRSLVTKRGKVLNKLEINKNKNVSKGRDSATVSPLPGLVVETEQLRKDDITSSIEANLLQKFKNIYTEVHDLSDTQNLISIANNHNNTDGEAGFTEHIETHEISDNSTEKSIATIGRSPITAHNDLDEVPPNVELLQEQYQHRDVNLEGISRDMAEFLDSMRSQFNSSRPVAVLQNTSPVLTRTHSKRSIKKQNTTSAESNATLPVVVIKRLSTEEIETNLNPVVTPSSSKVLSRKSSEEIVKCQSSQSKASSSTRSLQLVLDRLSSHDINKWLPIPPLTSRDTINDNKKSKKKETIKKPIGVTKSTAKIQETKCKSITTPTSNNTQKTPLKLIFSNTQDTFQENKLKSMISPVKLDFDSLGKADRADLKRYNTRSSIKSTKSHFTKVESNKAEVVEDLALICQKSSNTEATENCAKENEDNKHNKTQKSLASVNTTHTIRKNETKRLAAKSGSKIENSSDNSESTARIQHWFQNNVSACTPSKDDSAAVKDILAKVTESLETTLAEMHQSTREKLIHNYLENQKRFKAFKQDVCRRLDEMDKMLMEGATQVLREDAEKKALMVRLLQEDIQAALDLVEKGHK